MSCASIHPGQPIYRDAITILRQYQECQEWITNEPRIIPIYKKVREIGEILKYADIIDILEELRNGNPVPDRTERPYTIGDIRFIEKVFRDEFSFLFCRTSDKMSQFYDKVTRPNQNMKKESLNRNTGIKASIAVNYEEYDITQICAELDSVYDHNS